MNFISLLNIFALEVSAASGGAPSGELCTAVGGAAGINTAIGCLPFENTNALSGAVLGIGIGIAGGIAILMIIFAGFIITTSSGDPKRLQAGQELLSSAIAGVLLLIFSVFILRVLGVHILGIF